MNTEKTLLFVRRGRERKLMKHFVDKARCELLKQIQGEALAAKAMRSKNEN
jgi:hypothetical protein